MTRITLALILGSLLIASNGMAKTADKTRFHWLWEKHVGFGDKPKLGPCARRASSDFCSVNPEAVKVKQSA